jgi:hypothetical protein
MATKKQSTQETIQGCLALIVLLGCGWFAISSGLVGGLVDAVQTDRERQAVWTAEAVNLSPLEREIKHVLLTRENVRFNINDGGQVITVNYIMGDNFTKDMQVRGAELNMIDIVCKAKSLDFKYNNYTFLMTAEVVLVDSFGNESIADGLTVRLMPEQVSQINCDNRSNIRFSDIADFYRVHQALQ